MPTPSSMADLSTTAASNYPAGSENRSTIDDYHRALSALVRREQAKAANVASASTVNIGAIADGSFVHITGTTTITAFDTVSAGIERVLVFDGVLTLTHNASTLILPGGASITTAAGDIAVFRSEGSGNWRCVSYQKASGQAVVSTSLTGYAQLAVDQDWTGAQRSTANTDNDLSFDLTAGNNFTCTPTGSGTLTFTNIASATGQSGLIKLVNGSNYTISKHTNTKSNSTFASVVSTSGTYICSYYCDGTDVYVATDGAQS